MADSDLSHDGAWVITSSINEFIYLSPVYASDTEEPSVPLSISTAIDTGVWCIRFSPDDSEILAGGRDCCLHVLDVATNRVIAQIDGHMDHVNALCYADPSCPNTIVSGSDDSYIKVWDRRIMRSGCSPVGVLVGHLEGITYLSPRGDGRHILSNGKEQVMKLWDLRAMVSNKVYEDRYSADYRFEWDYRLHRFPLTTLTRRPGDTSLQDYTGHSVLKTLIRCRFAPAATTSHNLVYSGSYDGIVRVYHLHDGRLIQELDTNVPIDQEHWTSADRWYRHAQAPHDRHVSVVRDVDWHPHYPWLAATSWVGPDVSHGAVTCFRYQPH